MSDSYAVDSVASKSHRLSWNVVSAYGAPGIGAGYMGLLIGLYIMKFSTDVLLIAPVVMGTIFGVSRVWDAVSDPLVGYFSDRTRHSLGRRRLWLLISIIPVSASFIMVFSPPTTLHGSSLIAWMTLGVIGFYSALTIFIVPHMSLGAELTTDYHERSRLYGLRHIAFTIGSLLAVTSMYFLSVAETRGEQEVRQLSFQLSVAASVATAVLIAFAVIRLRERKDFQGRVSASPFKAFKDVWNNRHARLTLVVTFIEYIGSSVIGILTLYVAQYVVGRPELAAFIILSYMIPSAVSVPIWIPLSRRFGKIRLWMFSMMLTGLSFGGMFLMPFMELGLRTPWIFGLAVFAGLAAGCGGTIAPSIQSDIIDYDEYMTGERKEGSYFAAFNFAQKSAVGVMIFITGYVLQFSGFIPNQEQTMTVQIALVSLYGLLPLICYSIGTYLFSRFSLDESAYEKMRAEVDGRSVAQ
ncbi:MAG TPA: MFS transporter [Gammaproteobacteria bacterium]|nr:MFS transporter [Gammaproteobacteria bacterium]